MAAYATHKSTEEGKRETLARKAARAAKRTNTGPITLPSAHQRHAR